MKREKSCGALVYRITQNGQKELLFIKHRHGTHWSFPKGHMEEGENEVQTALREVKEETGLDIDLEGDFRPSVEIPFQVDIQAGLFSGTRQKRSRGPSGGGDRRNPLDSSGAGPYLGHFSQ